MQTKTKSLIEAMANVAVGYLVAIATQSVSFPMLGISATPLQNLALGAVFMVASLARSYMLRRLFDRWK